MRQIEKSAPIKPGDSTTAAKRKTNPSDIKLPPCYKIEVFAEGLNTPINMIITNKGEMLIADAGVTSLSYNGI